MVAAGVPPHREITLMGLKQPQRSPHGTRNWAILDHKSSGSNVKSAILVRLVVAKIGVCVTRKTCSCSYI